MQTDRILVSAQQAAGRIEPDDNAFPLLPGERRTIHLRGDTPLNNEMIHATGLPSQPPTVDAAAH